MAIAVSTDKAYMTIYMDYICFLDSELYLQKDIEEVIVNINSNT